ncbi:HAD-IA family hydrolase [bacterium]|nr:HAD-IA family hydrolase [bacterium]
MPTRTITALLFDLDQTLYAPETGLLPAGDRRITDYLAHRLNLPREQADAERRRLWREYGTTARGAEIEYGLPQRELYLHSLEDLDPREYLGRDEALAGMLQGLDADRFVVTNAAGNYARRVLAALGIDHCFQRVFDIEALGWRPKPEHAAYQCVLDALGRPAAEVGMVEDFPWNLVPAQELGMLTVYLGADEAEADVTLTNLLDLPAALAEAGVRLTHPRR